MSVYNTKHKGVIQSFAGTGNGTFCVGGWQYYEANLPTGEVDANGTAIYAIYDIPQSTVMYAVDNEGSGCEIKMTPASYNLSSANATLDNVTVWSANSILTRSYADARYAPAVSLPNITHGVSSIRHAFSGPNRTIAGDVFNGGNKTGYAGFETNNGSLSRYTAGQMLNVGTDERQSYFQSTENGITFGAYRVTNDANGSPVYQFYRSFFQVSSQGFSSAVFDQNFNQALFNVSPTGTQIDAGGAGVLELTGDDVTVDTNQATPGPLSVLNRTMGDARYARLVVSGPR